MHVSLQRTIWTVFLKILGNLLLKSRFKNKPKGALGNFCRVKRQRTLLQVKLPQMEAHKIVSGGNI